MPISTLIPESEVKSGTLWGKAPAEIFSTRGPHTHPRRGLSAAEDRDSLSI